MNVFAKIEGRLVEFAAEQHAVLRRDRGGESLKPSGPNNAVFEERRIDWEKDGMRLAVIIQPDFLVTGVDITKWNFRALAWRYQGNTKLIAHQQWVKSNSFQLIEEQIEGLLTEASTFLNGLQPTDLKAYFDW